jgi:hypothetical protein
MTTAAAGGSVILLKARERRHCTNTKCGCQVVGEIEGQNPRCACGGIMRKKYASLVFTYLGSSALRSAADPAARVAHPNHTRTLNMFADLLHLHSDARPTMALAVRGRAICTFSGRALVLTLSLAQLGTYLIVDEFKNPLSSQSPDLFAAAFILATGMTLLIELSQMFRTVRRHSVHSPALIQRPKVVAHPRQQSTGISGNIRACLPYNRAYVDRVRVRA